MSFTELFSRVYDSNITPEEHYNQKEEEYRHVLERPYAEVDPNLQVSTVIIAKGELYNDFLWDVMRKASLQTTDISTYEIIYVVNNTLDEASSQVPVFLENQDILFILDLLASSVADGASMDEWGPKVRERLGPRITEHEINILNTAILRKLKILPIDLSSVGSVLDLPEENKNLARGTSRDIGGHLAARRFGSLGKNGLIDFIDGDCFFPADYYECLQEAADGPEQVVHKPLYPVWNEYPKGIEELERNKRLPNLVKLALSSIMVNMDFYYNRLGTLLNGPQIAVKSEYFNERGGYYTGWDPNEDIAFSVLMGIPGDAREKAMEMVVYLHDRKRSDSVDGNLRGFFDCTGDIIADIEEIRGYMNGQAQIKKNAMVVLDREMECIYGEEYEELKSKLFRNESIRRNAFIANSRRTIERVVQAFQQGRLNTDSTGVEVLEEIRGISDSQSLNNREMDFFQSRPLFLEAIVDIIKLPVDNGHGEDISTDLILSFLEFFIPEYFLKPQSKEIVNAGASDNIRDYVHIPYAAYLMQARRISATW